MYISQMAEYKQSNGNQTFRDTDYMAVTPTWAVFGDGHRGFDPNETRWHRKKRKDISGCQKIVERMFIKLWNIRSDPEVFPW